jgi:hypothetical protein
MRLFVLSLSALLLLPGCGVNEDNYVEKFAKVVCELYYDCFEEFGEYWDDVDACVDETAELLDDGDESYTDCEFDSKNARKCIDSYEAITCEQIDANTYEIDEEACENIWAC